MATRSLRVVTACVGVVVLTLLGACGSVGHDPSGPVGSLVIDEVAWPTTLSEVTDAMRSMPAELDGLGKETTGGDGTSVTLDYGSDQQPRGVTLTAASSPGLDDLGFMGPATLYYQDFAKLDCQPGTYSGTAPTADDRYAPGISADYQFAAGEVPWFSCVVGEAGSPGVVTLGWLSGAVAWHLRASDEDLARAALDEFRRALAGAE